MTDLTKYYIDLSKCSESEIKELEKRTSRKFYYIGLAPFLHLFGKHWNQCMSESHSIKHKQELTYPEFIKLFNYTVQEDMICPVNKNHCDDECCTIGSTCNLSGNHNLKTSDPNELKNPELFEGGEGNNGWIKIEGIANEIKVSGNLWVVNKYGAIEFVDELEYIPLGYVTHYQPIIKPEPPKF